MTEHVTVVMSGPTLTFLLHDTMKSSLVQEGFLLGEIIEKKTSTITDNDQEQITITKEIHLRSSIPIFDTFQFYDVFGTIDVEWITQFLGRLTEKVIGWYIFRPQSAATLSYREQIIHRQLSELFQVPQDLFTCCLLTDEHTEDGATHTLCQSFLRYSNHSTDFFPIHIVNMSDPNNTYKTPSKVADSFRKLVSELKLDSLSNGLGCVTQIHNAMQKKTDQMSVELAKLEEQLYKLENQVFDVQTKNILVDLGEQEEIEEKREVCEQKTRRTRRGKNI